MSLTVDKKSLSYPVNSDFNEIKQDSFSLLPKELFFQIFLQLNFATIITISSISQKWKQLARAPILLQSVIYREIAFTNEQWARCFGGNVVKDEDRKEEFSSLPWHEFIEDCKKFKSIFPEKNALNNLMLVRLPKTFNGGLTLKSLRKLAKKYFLGKDLENSFNWRAIFDRPGENPIDKSRWIAMTKGLLPGSKNKTFAEQQDIIGKLALIALMGYEIPDTLEAAACLLAQYFDSNTPLIGDASWTYTRCKDEIQDSHPIVGDITLAGFYLETIDNSSHPLIGVAALRNF